VRIIKKYKMFLESTKSMLDIIPQSVKDLHKLFAANGKKLYLVGGSVRDFLTGDKPKDFDLATDALPDEVLEILGDKFRTNLQGRAFGVVVVFTKDQPEGMEIATFREDVYDEKLGKTRNPDVKFSTIENDVLRRDLRINGLFYDLDKNEIVDLVGGIDDIKNGVISMIGEPDLRIKEDPLRILRAIRMACRL
jgi:poly(A) polymerase